MWSGFFVFFSQIDPAFAHFSNLTELDLGRNRLQALGNLPQGLVSLSCAANELCGKMSGLWFLRVQGMSRRRGIELKQLRFSCLSKKQTFP